MAGRILEIRDQIDASLHDTDKPWTKCFEEAERKSGVDRLYIFVGLIGLVGMWLVFGYAAQLVCNIVGFVYPAYCSIKAIESSNKDDDTKWLIYWVVYAVFSVGEFFADRIVQYFPLYWLIKCIFFGWCMIPIPLFNGSTVIYNSVVRPYFLKHEGTIDETLSKVQNKVGQGIEKLEKRL